MPKILNINISKMVSASKHDRQFIQATFATMRRSVFLETNMDNGASMEFLTDKEQIFMTIGLAIVTGFASVVAVTAKESAKAELLLKGELTPPQVDFAAEQWSYSTHSSSFSANFSPSGYHPKLSRRIQMRSFSGIDHLSQKPISQHILDTQIDRLNETSHATLSERPLIMSFDQILERSRQSIIYSIDQMEMFLDEHPSFQGVGIPKIVA